MLFLLLLRFVIVFCAIPFIIFLLGLSIYKQKLRKGNQVMVPGGEHGKIIEVVKYEDMTLYGVRVDNEIRHYKRDQLVRKS